MYCGSNKTALQSQRQIACAMMELIREKPYTQITVSELCKAAGISRQTFYSLFTSRENVIVFGLQANSCEGPELPPEEASDDAGALQRLCRAYSRYLVQNRDLIKLLVDNRIEYLLYDSFFASILFDDSFRKEVRGAALKEKRFFDIVFPSAGKQIYIINQ